MWPGQRTLGCFPDRICYARGFIGYDHLPLGMQPTQRFRLFGPSRLDTNEGLARRGPQLRGIGLDLDETPQGLGQLLAPRLELRPQRPEELLLTRRRDCCLLRKPEQNAVPQQPREKGRLAHPMTRADRDPGLRAVLRRSVVG